MSYIYFKLFFLFKLFFEIICDTIITYHNEIILILSKYLIKIIEINK